ncbi:MAG TPA: CDP-diacylglycerol--glycerol-3-phosphate 3-phosphatidyltransferase [Thermodesulfatator atlanticus]|uniref:CDP-diacylglycerol--glycerol-3-phosphate 3-phosphatidyltransferase n=1 Tax=Thermodesulfatator atlanticus TaxID=501497 RepID=A0A7V5NYH0_9BACT|nr:CDP-diacylglycerol--glycerol-3-phosphate 3-phosphatidyltransferase [Thermodesulfatator atlanticus]
MLNVPNCITLLRLFLIPVIIIALLEGHPRLALLFFIVAGISDALDGFLARALKQKTLLGAILDPIADKLLINTIYILGAYLGLLPDWLAVIVISRDVMILIGFLILTWHTRKIEVKPTVLSKGTTVAQISTVVITLAHFSEGIKALACYLTAGLTIVSGMHYLFLGLKMLEGNKKGERPA